MKTKMSRSLRRTQLVALTTLLIPLLAAACGTLEVGIEPAPTVDSAASPTLDPSSIDEANLATPEAILQIATETVPPTPEPTSTPVPEPSGLRVAFVKDGNAWIWMARQEAIYLTRASGVEGVTISDDRAIVAFTREGGLWAVNSDGTDERQLVGAPDFEAIEPREPFELGVALYRFKWIPGTHVLAFNTHLRMEIGLALNDDLHLVNADTLERSVLLPPGEGGQFYYSPDGQQVAIVTSGTIRLVNADGSERREAFTYTPVVTYSEFQYYAQPAWAPDSDSLRVAIPPADPYADPPQPTAIWRIPTDRPSAELIASITATLRNEPAFSHYISHVAYLQPPEGALPGIAESELLIRKLDDGTTATHYPTATNIYGWAPDSMRFAFLTNPPSAQALIGQPGGDAVPVVAGAAPAVIDVSWVDANHYLFLAQRRQGWDILLGEIGGTPVLVATVDGPPPRYDFAH